MGCFAVSGFFVCPKFVDGGMFPFFWGAMVKNPNILHLLRDGCV